MEKEQIIVNYKQLAVIIVLVVVIIGGLIGLLSSSSGKDSQTAPATKAKVKPASDTKGSDNFLGEKGDLVKAENGKIYIEEEKVADGNIHYFNYLESGQNKTIYFFIIKASDGTYRAAANACEVCFDAKKGFKQVGDLIRCENCQITYPKDKIALEKGGCNPGPINKNVVVENKKLVINIKDLEAVSYLF
ncbi:Fe-S-containing protein [Patescibacteria group bacterium]